MAKCLWMTAYGVKVAVSLYAIGHSLWNLHSGDGNAFIYWLSIAGGITGVVTGVYWIVSLLGV